MWIFLIEIAGTVLSLYGWFALHSFWMLLAGSLMVLAFDLLMFSSGGQLKHNGISLIFLIIGGITGKISSYGIPESALLAYSLYSAFFVLIKLILVVLAAIDDELE